MLLEHETRRNSPLVLLPSRVVPVLLLPRSLIEEVRGTRRDHNLAGPSSIRDVAQALRRNVLIGDLKRVLQTLPPEAQRYWLD